MPLVHQAPYIVEIEPFYYEVTVSAVGERGPQGPPGPTGPQGPVGPRAGIEFSRPGALTLYTGTFRWYNDTGSARTFEQVRASVGEAPTGQSILVDVNINGVSIYTTQSNRPTILDGELTALGGAPDITTVQPGEYLTVDIDQVGSGAPGTNLVVQISMS